MHACARVYTYTHAHTHVSNKMFIPVNLMKRQTDPPKKQTKIEEESKNAYEKFRGEFPILKFQMVLSKKSKNKIEKSFKKSPKLFSILFLKKILDKFYISFTSSYRILPYHHG